VLGTSAASVTFSSIPQTYKHLQIRAVVRSAQTSNTDALLVKLNGTTTGYGTHRLLGTGSSVQSEWNPDAAKWEFNFFPGNTASANVFKAAIIDLLDYASTSKNKTARVLHGVHEPTEPTTRINLDSGLWANLSAVSSIAFTQNSGSNILTGSRFSLYGIKG
jgi:hypothetical protein